MDPFGGVLSDEADASRGDQSNVSLINVASRYKNPDRQPNTYPPLHDRVARLVSNADGDSPELFYKIAGKSLKGRAVIINISKFTGDEQSRQGSQRDAISMLACLESLGFKVEVYDNLTSAQFYQLILHLSVDPRKQHSKVDAFAMVILSHGTQNREGHDVIMSSDSEEIEFKYITSQFAGNVAKTLAGKPKIFFVQACRGDKTDPGREIAVDSSDGVEGLGRGMGEDETDFFFRTITIPAEADIFVAYSTPPGYYSWRSPESGSYFMQLLAYRLFHNAYLQDYDLQTVVTLVSHDLVRFQSNVPQDDRMHKKKQVPWVSSTLTKKLKFKP
ncbi:caspase-7-like isoform X2 [Convolutriloba macropyga]|uniref:caspase-7-like isoform X2 n=1 Tax=Convolutriloba macropyga TaxID=536237 RepID=UPI003F51E17B